jgi:Tol biopolymer transport system component
MTDDVPENSHTASGAGSVPDSQLPAAAGFRVRRREQVLWLAAGLIAGAFIATAATWLVMRPESRPAPAQMHFALHLPQFAPLDARGAPLALSPDGRLLVYVAQVSGGTQLFLRASEQLESTPIAGTEGAYGPFFSADGSSIVYFDARASKIKKLALSGGEAVTLGDAPLGLGGCWLPDGSIVYAPDVYSGLTIIPPRGGSPRALTRVQNGQFTHRWPEALPDGRSILFTAGTPGIPSAPSIVALSLASGRQKTVLSDAAFPRYLPTGHLLFLRSGRVMVQPMDLAGLQVRGMAIPILEGARADAALWSIQLSFSRTGTLVYAPRSPEGNLRSLIWGDRRGALQRMSVSQGAFSHPRFSPDGRRLALVMQGQDKSLRIGVLTIENGSFSRLTDVGNSDMPLWTPDGRWITFASDKDGRWSIYMAPADTSGPPVLLSQGDHPRLPTSWSPDGARLCFTEFHPDSGADIWVLSVRENRASPFLQRRTGEWGGVFSPDGRWLAYTSDESGPNQVYVRPFPGPGEPLQLSTAEGEEPVWSPQGGELFYRYWKRMMSVTLRFDPEFSAEAPRFLFEGPYGQGEVPVFQNYDLTPDGQRFVLIQSEEEGDNLLHFEIHWFEALATAVLAKEHSRPLK